MLRFSQPQSSCLAVCSFPSHPAAEGELPRLRLGSQLWWRPHPCRGPYFLPWVCLLFFKGRAIPHSPAMPSAHTPCSPTHGPACFFLGPLPAAACLSPRAVRACPLHHTALSSPPHYSETLVHTWASQPRPHFWAHSRIPLSNVQLCPSPTCFLANCPQNAAFRGSWHFWSSGQGPAAQLIPQGW